MILDTSEPQKMKLRMVGSHLSSTATAKRLEYGHAQRMVYEYMPEEDSDINSEKKTVDLEGQ